MAKTTRRFIPRLEAFDDRCVPSITNVIYDGSTLQIVADDGDDNIAITESGGLLTVYENGVEVFSAAPVAFVQVFTNGGDDIVTYTVSGELTHHQTFKAELGAGNDVFNGNLDGVTIGPDVDLIVQAFGRAGGDTFNMSAAGTHVGANSSLFIDLIAGKGKATWNTNYDTVTVDPTGLFIHNESRK